MLKIETYNAATRSFLKNHLTYHIVACYEGAKCERGSLLLNAILTFFSILIPRAACPPKAALPFYGVASGYAFGFRLRSSSYDGTRRPDKSFRWFSININNHRLRSPIAPATVKCPEFSQHRRKLIDDYYGILRRQSLDRNASKATG